MKTIAKKEIYKKLGELVKVQNIKSNKSGRAVANQLEMIYKGGYAFISYGTLIAVMIEGKYYLTDYHDYSRTTSKYCTQWTYLNTEERRKGLENGIITLIK